MKSFYPNIKPYADHQIEVGDGHVLHVEECGEKSGVPIVFVHGGPGAGCSTNDRCFFDPEKYRIILFDQRGSGRSTPHASLKSNTTPALIADMEEIRSTLGIERWILFGGSWGSTLSLLYAQAHPGRVMAMVLRGIFLCRNKDIEWFYKAGADRIFPDFWQDFLEPVADSGGNDLIAAYRKRLQGENELEQMAAAKAWSIWEGRCATLDPNPHLVEHLSNPHTALSLARIENHFFFHQSFIDENQILDNMAVLADIPAIIVHGRYDMVCPINQAYDLHRAWPGSRLEIIRDAGHASSEPGILNELIRATDELAVQFTGSDNRA